MTPEQLQHNLELVQRQYKELLLETDREKTELFARIERYRKALEDIAYDTELNITDSYRMVLHARKTLKGDETA